MSTLDPRAEQAGEQTEAITLSLQSTNMILRSPVLEKTRLHKPLHSL